MELAEAFNESRGKNGSHLYNQKTLDARKALESAVQSLVDRCSKAERQEPMAWYVERQDPGGIDDGLKYGPFWKLRDAKVWCEKNHTLHALFNTPVLEPSYSDVQLAEQIMSDCGCSTSNERLLERITARLANHTPPENGYGPTIPPALCCHKCFAASGKMLLDRMILCPQCGNKRCPKASDHRMDCTGSNELGQLGSVFATPSTEPAPFDHRQAAFDGLRDAMNRSLHAFTATKTGAHIEWEPTAAAFDLPDGQHALYTSPERPASMGPARQTEATTDSYDSLWNAVSRIDTVATMLPTFEVTHEGGIEAVTQNIVEAINRAAERLATPAQTTFVQEWMKPHPKCDRNCMLICTHGFTRFPECVSTATAVQEYDMGKIERDCLSYAGLICLGPIKDAYRLFQAQGKTVEDFDKCAWDALIKAVKHAVELTAREMRKPVWPYALDTPPVAHSVPTCSGCGDGLVGSKVDGALCCDCAYRPTRDT
jgi:hypothetical protein